MAYKVTNTELVFQKQDKYQLKINVVSIIQNGMVCVYYLLTLVHYCRILFLLWHFLIDQMLTMPVLSKTSYSCLSKAYENSSFNFCVCLHRGMFVVVVVVRITWNLIFVLFSPSAVTGFHNINFPFLQSLKMFFYKFQNWWKKC